MVDTSSSRQDALRQLSEALLRSAGRTRVRCNVLELHHPGAPLFDPFLLNGTGPALGVSISLSLDTQATEGQPVRCRSAQLPFQDGAFGMVVLHHVIGNGDEPELAEAARVLSGSGVLLVLGLNRFGWRYRAQRDGRRLPGLAPLRVGARLDRLDMVLQGFAGAGLAGRERPAFMNSGPLGLLSPLADVVLLQAQHRGGPGVMPLRFRKSRAHVVQSAAMRG